MKSMSRIVRRAGIVAALIAGLALSACANKQASDAMASAGVAVARQPAGLRGQCR